MSADNGIYIARFPTELGCEYRVAHLQAIDNYSTGYTAGIIANQIAQAQWLDSVQTSITAGVTQYMKRYNRTSLLLEEYNGSAWVNLALNYATLIYSNSFTGLQNITTLILTHQLGIRVISAPLRLLISRESLKSSSTNNFLADHYWVQYPPLVIKTKSILPCNAKS